MLSLYQRQVALEQESLAVGQARYLASVESAKTAGDEDTLGPVRGLIKRAMSAVTEAIDLKREPRKGPGRGMSALKFIEGIESSALAFHALRSAMASISGKVEMTKIVGSIGRAIAEERKFRTLADLDAKLYRMTQTHIKTATTGGRKRRIMNHMSTQVPDAMTEAECTQVGALLLDAILESTNLFRMGMITKGVSSTRTVEATEEVMRWLLDGHERTSMFLPVRLPMVHKPNDWTSPRSGGYLTNIGGRLDMIKTRNEGYLDSLEDVDMPVVYTALNAIQSVRWAINRDVLAVANECWTRGFEVGSSMPTQDFKPVPPIPCSPDQLPQLRKDDPATYKAWAQQAAQVHEDNAKAISRRMACGERLNIAAKFAPFEAIYFPHQLDFRGRMYPIPVHLHPQADDLSRGLLQMAEGSVPGERGMFWLAVHIANCHGVDKVSHADRVRWVQARMTMWREIAEAPLQYRDWMSASDPWQALAAIMDYVRCTDDSQALSRLSISMDGSCNGLQNFSAMLGDPVGAAATNVLPSDKPADVYGEVAAIVDRMVNADAVTGNEFAIIWQGKINRKLVKQPVMTLPYGATLSGMRGQIEAAMNKQYPGLFPKTKAWAACGYLASITYSAIGKVVVAAREAMEWLQHVAREVASVDYPIRWTAPNGLPVLQDYREKVSSSVRIHIDGVKVDLELAADGDKLNRRRQSLAISPNLVHSYDAAHLQGTVMLCLEKGLTSFSFIHDSYGTLASDVDTLHWCLREAFIRQYTPNLLAKFASEVADQVNESVVIPPPPAVGPLDLSLVHKSVYFFS